MAFPTGTLYLGSSETSRRSEAQMETRKQSAAVLAAAATLLIAARALARRRRAYRFQGKTVLITGGSRGLGLVLAREFASEGARLVLTARDREELERAAEELRLRGAEVLAHPADVTDRAQVEELVRAAVTRFGAVDVLGNNARQIKVGPLAG